MKKTKVPRRKKFRLLFDTSFAKPTAFKKLYTKANLAHVRHTYNLSSTTEDKDIYQLATQEKRIVVTIDEDFKKLVKRGKTGIMFISPYLSTKQMDEVLTAFVQGKDPDDFLGKATKI